MGLSYFFLAVKWWVGSMEIHLMAPVWVSLCFAEQCFLMIIDISGTCIYPKYFVYNYNTSSRYNEYSRVANVTCDLCSCELLSASSSTRPGVRSQKAPAVTRLAEMRSSNVGRDTGKSKLEQIWCICACPSNEFVGHEAIPAINRYTLYYPPENQHIPPGGKEHHVHSFSKVPWEKDMLVSRRVYCPHVQYLANASLKNSVISPLYFSKQICLTMTMPFPNMHVFGVCVCVSLDSKSECACPTLRDDNSDVSPTIGGPSSVELSLGFSCRVTLLQVKGFGPAEVVWRIGSWTITTESIWVSQDLIGSAWFGISLWRKDIEIGCVRYSLVLADETHRRIKTHIVS